MKTSLKYLRSKIAAKEALELAEKKVKFDKALTDAYMKSKSKKAKERMVKRSDSLIVRKNYKPSTNRTSLEIASNYKRADRFQNHNNLAKEYKKESNTYYPES